MDTTNYLRKFNIRIPNIKEIVSVKNRTEQLIDASHDQAILHSETFYNYFRRCRILLTCSSDEEEQYLGIYLSLQNFSKERGHKVIFGLKLINEHNSNDNRYMECPDLFLFSGGTIDMNEFNEYDWGYEYFIDFNTLLDPQNGFIHLNNSLCIEVLIYDCYVESKRMRKELLVWSLWCGQTRAETDETETRFWISLLPEEVLLDCLEMVFGSF